MGSPPHVRGKDTLNRSIIHRDGITPACAGKRDGFFPDAYHRRDHPRMCGEKSFTLRKRDLQLGSPPHVRGKARCFLHRIASSGITPACAGKSRFLPYRGYKPWDHPRMCGEKQLKMRMAPPITGSPPHVRGKVGIMPITRNTRGITPACAGKRGAPDVRVRSKWDHPRMCGEKIRVPREVLRMPGSPPHVRGKDWVTAVLVERPGITPACAGKRPNRPGRQRIPRDHPRMCGEKT